jgi:integrative and conjugative element protein (TIGR02256 family)
LTVHAALPALDPIDAVDQWFATLRAQRPARLSPAEHKGAGAGWRLKVRGRDVDVLTDQDFPHSRPTIHLTGHTSGEHLPHVEASGKLCLRNVAIPSDPVAAVTSAIADASSLLRAIAIGEEESDFQEDFLLYWGNAADQTGTPVSHLTDPAGSDPYIAYAEARDGIYAFDTKVVGRRWLTNFAGSAPAPFRQGVRIALRTLPSPNRYPRAVLLRRKTDPGGRPIHRRELFRGYPTLGDVPGEVLSDHFQMFRLASRRLDSGSTRLPFDDIGALSTKQVGIIGCGALGSSVAMTLVKSGVSNLTLVDDAVLDWENIRRHELGSRYVGCGKASSLAGRIKSHLPDVQSIRVHESTIQALLRTDPVFHPRTGSGDLLYRYLGGGFGAQRFPGATRSRAGGDLRMVGSACLGRSRRPAGQFWAFSVGWLRAYRFISSTGVVQQQGKPARMRRRNVAFRRPRTRPCGLARRAPRAGRLASAKSGPDLADLADRCRGAGRCERRMDVRLDTATRRAALNRWDRRRRVDILMAGGDITYRASGHETTVIMERAALAVFERHRQLRFFHCEAGGQLFARIDGSTWTVAQVSGPRSADKRGRFHFWPDRSSEQSEIYAYHKQGLEYVGDWHTHPEDRPTPSAIDRSSMLNVVRDSTHHFPGFLMCIIGRIAFRTACGFRFIR